MCGVKSISLLRHWIPTDKPSPAYWHGDEIDISVIWTDDYKRKSERMMSKLQRFLVSDLLNVAIVEGFVSSFPRWRYMRELEKKPWRHGDASDASDLVIYRPNETRRAKL